jgi:hypothetical protein
MTDIDSFGKQMRAIKLSNARETRRIKSEAILSKSLPLIFETNFSYHCISHGDIDSLSYLRHILLAPNIYFEEIIISSWCIGTEDVKEILGFIDSGKLESVKWYVGKIFPGQYAEAYDLIKKNLDIFGMTLMVVRNHSKIIAAKNCKLNYFISIESSANINTNPRIEQTVITASEDLYYFYDDFFSGIKSIERKS